MPLAAEGGGDGDAAGCCGLPDPGGVDSESDDDGGGAAAAARAPRARGVSRVDAEGTTPGQFYEKYVTARVPVVLRRGEGVPTHLTTRWLLERRGACALPLDGGAAAGGAPRPLRDFLDAADPALRRRYLRNVTVTAALGEEEGAAAMRRPPHLERGTRLVGDVELFVCGHDCPGFPFLHQDTCHTHAYSLQAQGVKEWTLFPPSDRPYLYADGLRSAIPDVRRVDLAAYPLFAHATPHVVMLTPGDALFLPCDWWHTTRCVSRDLSVSVGGSLVDATTQAEFSADYAERVLWFAELEKVGAGSIDKVAAGATAGAPPP